MGAKTVLVCLFDEATAKAAIACAVQLARAQSAHLVGLHVLDALVVYPGTAMPMTSEVASAFDLGQRERAAAIKAIFDTLTEPEDFVAEWRLLQANTPSSADRMIDSARLADVVVMPNATAAEDIDSHMQVRVIREAGRPVIVVPPDYDHDTLATRVVLGWSDTREAARAAHDLLLVVEPGAEVSVLRVTAGARDPLKDSALLELASLYDRHGLRAGTQIRAHDGEDVAEILTDHAFELGADLIVTGAFGHSRVYDFVLGAVTHGLLRSARVPVLFSH
jgi:nucleotide-binding universal stress UspA family protein